MKLLIKNTSVNIRSLYQLKNNCYIVKIKNFNHGTNSYHKSYSVPFEYFSDALAYVNFKTYETGLQNVKQ